MRWSERHITYHNYGQKEKPRVSKEGIKRRKQSRASDRNIRADQERQTLSLCFILSPLKGNYHQCLISLAKSTGYYKSWTIPLLFLNIFEQQE